MTRETGGAKIAGHRQRLGRRGEQRAADWYTAAGYEVLARNWTCTLGELDLVARKGGTYVFCEVKTRTSEAFGSPAEAVTAVKQARIRRLAARWLAEARAADRATPGPRAVRFDVAAVLGPRIEVIEEAF